MNRLLRHYLCFLRTNVRVMCVCVLAAISLHFSPTARADELADEYDLKVAYLFNIFGLAELSGRTVAQTYTLCVLAPAATDASFNELKTEAVQGRSIALKVRPEQSTLEDCDALFISRDQAELEGKVLAKVKGKGVLTVGERDGFCNRGGVINLYFEEKKLKFEVNLARAKEEDIKMPAKLLKHGRVIE